MQFCWDGQEPLEFSLIQDPSFVYRSHRLCSLQVKAMEVDGDERPKELVRKPYVLNGGCWPHSSRSSSCTVRPRKGPQMSSFYRWKKQPQREEGSWSGAHKVKPVSDWDIFSLLPNLKCVKWGQRCSGRMQPGAQEDRKETRVSGTCSACHEFKDEQIFIEIPASHLIFSGTNQFRVS